VSNDCKLHLSEIGRWNFVSWLVVLEYFCSTWFLFSLASLYSGMQLKYLLGLFFVLKPSCRKHPSGCRTSTRNLLKHRNGYETPSKCHRSYRMAFPDLETSYGMADGVSWLYWPIRSTFRASLRRNKKKKRGAMGPPTVKFFFFIFYVFLESLLHFFASLCFSCNIMSYF